MGNQESLLISVVTPVYNGEKYIDACIKSVRSQTYKNWEYVIINNCSTDKTPDIVSRHVEEDQRIRMIATDSVLPLISNHNFALQQISPDSDYCKMVHADDMLLPACLEHMAASAVANPSAGIVGSYSLWGKKVVSDGLPLSTTFFPGKEIARLNLLNQVCTFWSPSSLLIRSDLIRKRQPFYNEQYLHADDEAHYELLRESDFAFVHQVLTFIRTHDESATATITASYNKIMLSNIDLYLRYGPIYLSSSEFKKHLKTVTRQYYGFLANSLFELKEKDFWRYHQETCQKIGFPLNRTKLIKATISQLIGRPYLNLKKLISAAVNKS